MADPILLSPYEESCLLDVFGPQLCLRTMRLRFGSLLSIGASRTTGRTISLQRSWQTIRNEPIFLGLLVHEIVHVWQFHRVGWSYAWGSLWEQWIAWVKRGSRHAAYRYFLDESTNFCNYGYEQQAQMIQDWFLRTRFAVYDGYTAEYCTNFRELGEMSANRLVDRYVTHIRDWSR